MSAVAVVDGATVVIDPPSSAVRLGISAAWSCTAFHPRPSSTSSTTESADRAGSGIQASSAIPNSDGTSPATDAPARAGMTGST